MSAAAREAQWIRRRTVCAGHATFVQYSSRLLPCSVSAVPQDGQPLGRGDIALLAGALRRVEHSGDERDHVARAADEHRVADLDVAGADDLLVGERRARHRRAADEHRLEHGDGRDLADLADVPHHVGEHRGLLLGGELEGERPARGVGARAGGGEGGAVGEPEHGAVEVVVEVVAVLLDAADDLLRLRGVLAARRLRGVEAQLAQRLAEVVGRLAALRVEVEGEESQPPPGDRLRVLRAHGARGGVARVDERLVRVRLVVLRERGAQHHELPADLGAALGVDLRRDSLGHRAGQRGHVLAGRPVAARDGAREPPVLVDDGERQPVELRHHDDVLAREAVEERLDLLRLRGLLEREHRPRVANGRVQHRRRADVLERVVLRCEVGVLGEQRAQLVLDRVVVGVGHERVAAVIRVAQLRQAPGERFDPLARVRARAHPVSLGDKTLWAFFAAGPARNVPGTFLAGRRQASSVPPTILRSGS